MQAYLPRVTFSSLALFELFLTVDPTGLSSVLRSNPYAVGMLSPASVLRCKKCSRDDLTIQCPCGLSGADLGSEVMDMEGFLSQGPVEIPVAPGWGPSRMRIDTLRLE